MSSKYEITRKYALAYRRANKKDKGLILDQVCAVTSWSRDNARRRLTKSEIAPVGSLRAVKKGKNSRTNSDGSKRKPRLKHYSDDIFTVLVKIWALSGFSCGKYLIVSMPTLLDNLATHGVLVVGIECYSWEVKNELRSMSSATIDRYLGRAKEKDQIKGLSGTKPGNMIRTLIPVRKAGDEAEKKAGFFECDTLAHCGPVLSGEFMRTVNFTDIYNGWVYTVAIRNNAHGHIRNAFIKVHNNIPYSISGFDCDNGSEFMNQYIVKWVEENNYTLTRSRPYQKNDQAHIESKNNHLVCKHGFHYRYDTALELKLLNQLWGLVCDRMNYFTPTKKPIGYTQSLSGKRKRLDDIPKTPVEQVLEDETIPDEIKEKLTKRRGERSLGVGAMVEVIMMI